MQAITVISILDNLRGAGITAVPTDDGRITLQSAKPIDRGLLQLVRENKPALLEYLRQQAANDPGQPDLDLPGTGSDRYAWPHSEAMNSAEIETFTARLCLFASRGLQVDWADSFADRLTRRDREGDSRSTCLECRHLAGRTCAAWRQAGVGGAQLPAELIAKLQRCPGFEAAPLTQEPQP